jgi:hypothetical protein
MARVVRAALAVVGLLLYVWYAAVRNLPRVRTKKSARRD